MGIEQSVPVQPVTAFEASGCTVHSTDGVWMQSQLSLLMQIPPFKQLEYSSEEA